MKPKLSVKTLIWGTYILALFLMFLEGRTASIAPAAIDLMDPARKLGADLGDDGNTFTEASLARQMFGAQQSVNQNIFDRAYYIDITDPKQTELALMVVMTKPTASDEPRGVVKAGLYNTQNDQWEKPPISFDNLHEELTLTNFNLFDLDDGEYIITYETPANSTRGAQVFGQKFIASGNGSLSPDGSRLTLATSSVSTIHTASKTACDGKQLVIGYLDNVNHFSMVAYNLRDPLLRPIKISTQIVDKTLMGPQQFSVNGQTIFVKMPNDDMPYCFSLFNAHTSYRAAPLTGLAFDVQSRNPFTQPFTSGFLVSWPSHPSHDPFAVNLNTRVVDDQCRTISPDTTPLRNILQSYTAASVEVSVIFTADHQPLFFSFEAEDGATVYYPYLDRDSHQPQFHSYVIPASQLRNFSPSEAKILVDANQNLVVFWRNSLTGYPEISRIAPAFPLHISELKASTEGELVPSESIIVYDSMKGTIDSSEKTAIYNTGSCTFVDATRTTTNPFFFKSVNQIDGLSLVGTKGCTVILRTERPINARGPSLQAMVEFVKSDAMNSGDVILSIAGVLAILGLISAAGVAIYRRRNQFDPEGRYLLAQDRQNTINGDDELPDDDAIEDGPLIGRLPQVIEQRGGIGNFVREEGEGFTTTIDGVMP